MNNRKRTAQTVMSPGVAHTPTGRGGHRPSPDGDIIAGRKSGSPHQQTVIVSKKRRSLSVNQDAQIDELDTTPIHSNETAQQVEKTRQDTPKKVVAVSSDTTTIQSELQQNPSNIRPQEMTAADQETWLSQDTDLNQESWLNQSSAPEQEQWLNQDVEHLESPIDDEPLFVSNDDRVNAKTGAGTTRKKTPALATEKTTGNTEKPETKKTAAVSDKKRTTPVVSKTPHSVPQTPKTLAPEMTVAKEPELPVSTPNAQDIQQQETTSPNMDDVSGLLVNLKPDELESLVAQIGGLIANKKRDALIENAKKVREFAARTGIVLNVEDILNAQPGLNSVDQTGNTHRFSLPTEDKRHAAFNRISNTGEKVYLRPKPDVKYQNPNEPSEQWTGRGKTPIWLRELINAGADREDFRV